MGKAEDKAKGKAKGTVPFALSMKQKVPSPLLVSSLFCKRDADYAVRAPVFCAYEIDSYSRRCVSS
jgi:hypothetical protein